MHRIRPFNISGPPRPPPEAGDQKVYAPAEDKIVKDRSSGPGGSIITEEKNALKPVFSSAVTDFIGGEDLLLEVARELIKDEIKERIKATLKNNPGLEREIKDAVGMYFEAKVKETYAGLKLAKSGAKLTLEMLPEHMKKDLSKDLEKEVAQLLERALK